MILAHMPAGYIAARLLFSRLGTGLSFRPFLLAALLGAIAPDFDYFYFFFIDQRQHHHHTYWTHFPIVWAGLLLAALAWLRWGRAKKTAALAVIFAGNGMIHMLLDTVVGDIWWLAPFVDMPYSFFTVHPVYHPWWLNFILHWSFAVEWAIIAWAVYLWRQGPRQTCVKTESV